MIWYTAVAIALLPVHSTPDTVRVCLAPTSAQIVTGSSDAAIDAVRGTFTSFLTGPSLAVKPLTSRLTRNCWRLFRIPCASVPPKLAGVRSDRLKRKLSPACSRPAAMDRLIASG